MYSTSKLTIRPALPQIALWKCTDEKPWHSNTIYADIQETDETGNERSVQIVQSQLWENLMSNPERHGKNKTDEERKCEPLVTFPCREKLVCQTTPHYGLRVEALHSLTCFLLVNLLNTLIKQHLPDHTEVPFGSSSVSLWFVVILFIIM